MVKDAQKLCPASQMKVITETQRRSGLDRGRERQIARTPFPNIEEIKAREGQACALLMKLKPFFAKVCKDMRRRAAHCL